MAFLYYFKRLHKIALPTRGVWKSRFIREFLSVVKGYFVCVPRRLKHRFPGRREANFYLETARIVDPIFFLKCGSIYDATGRELLAYHRRIPECWTWLTALVRILNIYLPRFLQIKFKHLASLWSPGKISTRENFWAFFCQPAHTFSAVKSS